MLCVWADIGTGEQTKEERVRGRAGEAHGDLHKRKHRAQKAPRESRDEQQGPRRSAPAACAP